MSGGAFFRACDEQRGELIIMMRRRTFLTSASAAMAMSGLAKSALAAEPALKLFDTHAHFYTNDAARYPFKADIAPEALAKAKAAPMTDEVILKMWDAAGVEMGCGVQYATTYATDNRYLLDVVGRHPERILPVVILDPVAPETPATLARMAKENRITGVRFSGPPMTENGAWSFLSDASKGAWEMADDLGLVIVLMPFRGDLPNGMKIIGELADRYPNVRIEIDHFGFPTPGMSPTFGLSPQHLALSAHKNVYYKYTSLLIEQFIAVKTPPKALLEFLVGHYGADHIVWGSDVGNTAGDSRPCSTARPRACSSPADGALPRPDAPLRKKSKFVLRLFACERSYFNWYQLTHSWADGAGW
jgi:L-fuconolactonase